MKTTPSTRRPAQFKMAVPALRMRKGKTVQSVNSESKLDLIPESRPESRREEVRKRRRAQSAEEFARTPLAVISDLVEPAVIPQPVERQYATVLPAVRPRVLPDPHRALARVRTVRGQRVLLERDLASALGTLSGRLADLALRHADWFPASARFALSPSECAEQGLWYTRKEVSDGLQGLNTTDLSAIPAVVYTADGLVAAAHWLANEANRAGDPYSESEDLLQRFRLAWSALA